jgi:hypothetical protein
MKIAAGRHGTAVAGTRAMRKQATASAQPRMTTRELRGESWDGFPALAFGCTRKPTDAPSVSEALTFLVSVVPTRRIAPFAFRAVFAVARFLLGSARVGEEVGWGFARVGVVGVAMRDVGRGVVLFGAGVDRVCGGDFRGGGLLAAGGGEGAGTGAGSVGVDTVVGSGSSARAALEAKRPNATPVARIKRSGSRDRDALNECIASSDKPSGPPLQRPTSGGL